jgi:IclR family acetate operon transcriptional repressor
LTYIHLEKYAKSYVANDSSAVALQRRRKPKASSRSATHSGLRGDQYQLKAITRALDVLECFSDEQTALNLKDIAKQVDSPESSLFRILLTLKSQGYLLQNEDGSYRLPDKLLYGRVYERAERIRQALRPRLQALATRFDETASVAYRYGDQVRVLDTVETFHEIRMTNRPGRVLPPHCSSLGKAIAAFQESALAERMLEIYGLYRRTEHTIVDRQTLFDEFATIRERGYAFDRQETILGGICIGVPIIISGARVTAAISVSTPLVRMTAAREKEIAETLVETAARIAHDLRTED